MTLIVLFWKMCFYQVVSLIKENTFWGSFEQGVIALLAVVKSQLLTEILVKRSW